MTRETTLNATHREMGARMVPFGGWDMPLHYGSQLEEHHVVRRDAGMFDVSHMTAVDITGADTVPFLQKLLANNVAKLKTPGRALYSCMLNENAGVIDDLIVYRLTDEHHRIVVNAATTENDLEWIGKQAANFNVEVTSRQELDMIAVQGPNAREKALPLLPDDCSEAAELKPFNAVLGDSWMVARTGYTGEDGFEVMLPAEDSIGFWKALNDNGVAPCGLGARDTLRLEAGMNLYGTDMDDTKTPLESGLGWTVAWDPEERDFIGRNKLEEQKSQRGSARFVGLLLEGKGVLRNHQKLFDGDQEVGEITSGGFSPTLERSIAMARISAGDQETLDVDMRGRRLPVRLVKLPFVRNGKALIEL